MKFRTKNNSIYSDKNDNSILECELGIYQEENYDKALTLKTCEEKRNLATKLVTIGSDIHGAWSDELFPNAIKEVKLKNIG